MIELDLAKFRRDYAELLADVAARRTELGVRAAIAASRRSGGNVKLRSSAGAVPPSETMLRTMRSCSF